VADPRLEDETLAQEIDLLGDVVAAVSELECEGHLSDEQVDAALGVGDESRWAPPQTPNRSEADSA
jgi:hypothetical protein